jgi:RNA polymerase sigma-70 factor (ECF subfamily)
MNPYHNDSDAQLVALLISGDDRAFEVIYQRYAATLYRYARKNITVREDCEEIIQEVFESLWKRHDGLQHITALDAYLFRMVKYKVVGYFRHSNVKKKYAEHYRLFEALYNSVDEVDRTSATLQAMIDRGLSSLPERCRLAVKLRLDENLSNGDIARRMKISKSTVENYMVVAVSHLRTSLKSLRKA